MRVTIAVTILSDRIILSLQHRQAALSLDSPDAPRIGTDRCYLSATVASSV